MAIGTEVKVTKYTCVICRTSYFVESDDQEVPLGAYLEGMGHWGSGGGPISAFVDTDCLDTPLSKIVAEMYDMEETTWRETDEKLRLAKAADKPQSVAKKSRLTLAVSKSGKPWTKADKKAVMSSNDNKALAKELGRTEQAIHSMRWKLQREKDQEV